MERSVGMSEWEGLLRIGLAALLGGVIGFERETLHKAAGIRTHMLVTMGSAAFMVVAILLTEQYSGLTAARFVDPSRIGSTIVTGIGFLGGGIIFRGNDRVQGLTTAAGLWTCGAIGMACGAGYYITAVGGMALTLFVLMVILWLQHQLELKKEMPRRNTGALPGPDGGKRDHENLEPADLAED
jgi:putative Mg2+ transporter-C (MgtC) family protein